MICPKCKYEQDEDDQECPRCGIIFEKFRDPKRNVQKQVSSQSGEHPETITGRNRFQELFLHVELSVNPFYFVGRIALFLILIFWGWKFASCPIEGTCVNNSFLHLINLPFHEAGHIIFRPFGRFITSLGGSLAQLLMPLICIGAFILTRRDTFAASVCLWWFGQNFIDLAPYINDARAGVLPLLGGNTGRNAPYGFHDWEFILNELGCLRFDHQLASIAHKGGIALMILALLWGGYLLFKQSKNICY